MNEPLDYSGFVQKKEFQRYKVTVIFIIHHMNDTSMWRYP